MRWFDKDELKDKESLTAEQIEFLLQPSLTTWGIFNCIVRKQFDYLLAFFIVTVGLALLSQPEETGLISAIYIFFTLFLEGWIIYFFIKHGRRLAWNRNKWKSFDVFKNSEWEWWYIAVATLAIFFIQPFIMIWQTEEPDLIWGVFIYLLIVGLATFLPFFKAKKKRGQNEVCL